MTAEGGLQLRSKGSSSRSHNATPDIRKEDGVKPKFDSCYVGLWMQCGKAKICVLLLY